MYLMPFLLFICGANLLQARTIYNDDKNSSLSLQQLEEPNSLIFPNNYLTSILAPWADLWEPVRNGIYNVTSNEKELKIFVNVQNYKREEIEVNVEDGILYITANHTEENYNHTSISKNSIDIVYRMPVDIDIDSTDYTINSDGVLVFTAPVKKLSENEEKDGSFYSTNSETSNSTESSEIQMP